MLRKTAGRRLVLTAVLAMAVIGGAALSGCGGGQGDTGGVGGAGGGPLREGVVSGLSGPGVGSGLSGPGVVSGPCAPAQPFVREQRATPKEEAAGDGPCGATLTPAASARAGR